jgi:hypothetical protein
METIDRNCAQLAAAHPLRGMRQFSKPVSAPFNPLLFQHFASFPLPALWLKIFSIIVQLAPFLHYLIRQYV